MEYYFNITRDIFLETNQHWAQPDQELTPSKMTIQAVWPSLRHGHYLWKVVSVDTPDLVPENYNDYHCTSPKVLTCGQTNVRFQQLKQFNIFISNVHQICILGTVESGFCGLHFICQI